MESKYSMDFSKNHTFKTIVTGVLLGTLGLAIVLKIDGLNWLKGISPEKLTFYIVVTVLTGTFVHEVYHQFIAKMMGHDCSVKWFPIAAFPTIDDLARWEAIGIKLAPGFDLSIIAGLIIAFLPGPLNPILSMFLIGNMAGSASDLIQSYYIWKLSSQDSRIRLTDTGFEIR